MKFIIKFTISIILITVLLNSCIEEYDPKIDDYVEVPVLEGIITNELGPYVFKLSKTLTVYNLNYVPITGAKIKIEDDINTEDFLIETSPGTYQTINIQGIVGRKYRITINLNNKVYQSNFEELKEPAGIDSVFAKIEYKELEEGRLEGLQFYITTNNQIDKNSRLLWKSVETYEYKSDLTLKYICYSDTVIVVQEDSLKVCWRTENIYDAFIFSAENHSDSKVSNFPLQFTGVNTKKLTEKYSLLINQYCITDQAYTYWEKINDQLAESGSIYSKQPFQIRGNIENINSKGDLLFGYFMVAGVSKKRIFIERPSVDFDYPICTPDVFIYEVAKNDPTINWPKYATMLPSGEWGFDDYSCFDCQTAGGALIKPSFWED